MTVDQILRDIDEHGLSFGCNRLAEERPEYLWYVRIGPDYNKARRGATFEAALLAAWAAYTNAETRA